MSRDLNDFGQESKPLPDISNAQDLASVIVAGALICGSAMSNLPQEFHEKALESIMEVTEKYIKAYTDRYFVRRPE